MCGALSTHPSRHPQPRVQPLLRGRCADCTARGATAPRHTTVDQKEVGWRDDQHTIERHNPDLVWCNAPAPLRSIGCPRWLKERTVSGLPLASPEDPNVLAMLQRSHGEPPRTATRPHLLRSPPLPVSRAHSQPHGAPSAHHALHTSGRWPCGRDAEADRRFGGGGPTPTRAFHPESPVQGVVPNSCAKPAENQDTR